jgi:hypothetical protein
VGTAKKILLVVFSIFVAAILLGKFILDTTGEIAMLQEPRGLDGIWREGAHWLFSTPYWVPSILLLAIPIIVYWPDILRFLRSDQGVVVGAPGPSVAPTIVRPSSDIGTKTPCQIFIGDGPECVSIVRAGAYWTRTISVEIRNNTSKNIIDGELRAIEISPEPRLGGANCLIASGVQIAAQSRTFVATISYHEGTPIIDWMRLAIPIAPVLDGMDAGMLSIEPHSFRLQFRSKAESLFDDIPCVAWVGEDHILRLSDAARRPAVTPVYLSLYEAALRLIDAKIEWYDAASRHPGLSPDGPEVWWSYWMGERIDIYGKHSPARTLHTLPRSPQPNFKLEGKSIVSGSAKDGDRWEDLCIMSSSFPDLLEQAKKASGEYGAQR